MQRKYSVISHIKRGIKTLRGRGQIKVLMYSKRMKRYVREHPKIMTQAYKMIKEIHSKGDITPMHNQELGITITPEHIYSHRNCFNRGLYKVEIRGKTFFVKDSSFDFSPLQKGVWNRAQQVVEGFGGKIGSTKIQLIHPQLIYKNYLVSDYYGGKLVNVEEIQTNKSELNKKINFLDDELNKVGAIDCRPANIFYDKENDALYIFDLVSKPQYERMLESRKIQLIEDIRRGRT